MFENTSGLILKVLFTNRLTIHDMFILRRKSSVNNDNMNDKMFIRTEVRQVNILPENGTPKHPGRRTQTFHFLNLYFTSLD